MLIPDEMKQALGSIGLPPQVLELFANAMESLQNAGAYMGNGGADINVADIGSPSINAGQVASMPSLGGVDFGGINP